MSHDRPLILNSSPRGKFKISPELLGLAKRISVFIPPHGSWPQSIVLQLVLPSRTAEYELPATTRDQWTRLNDVLRQVATQRRIPYSLRLTDPGKTSDSKPEHESH